MYKYIITLLRPLCGVFLRINNDIYVCKLIGQTAYTYINLHELIYIYIGSYVICYFKHNILAYIYVEANPRNFPKLFIIQCTKPITTFSTFLLYGKPTTTNNSSQPKQHSVHYRRELLFALGYISLHIFISIDTIMCILYDTNCTIGTNYVEFEFM